MGNLFAGVFADTARWGVYTEGSLPVIREKLLRDPIHNLIAFDLDHAGDRLLLEALDTFEVQRLRRIRQLGMAHMAFQGAEHSRFTHSVGVLALVRRMLERLTKDNPIDPLASLAAMCAGLLHDIGHGPFSHVMEKFFREPHEYWSKRILLDPSTEIHRVLVRYAEELPDRVVELLDGEAEPEWLNTLVSSQMDADRFDYLVRDSHMTGVKYGVFDLDRLMMLLRVSSDGSKVVVASKGLLPVEKYLQSRYQMYRQVYFHKTVTAAEAMLMAVMERARELARDTGDVPGLAPDSSFLRLLMGDDLELDGYLQLDDASLLGAISNWSRCSDPILRDLALRLLTRRLFKSVEVGEDTDMLFDERISQGRNLLEDHGLDHRYYLRSSLSSDTPYRPYSPRGPRSTIWIQDAADPAILHDVSDLSPTIRAFQESPYSIHRVFFPAEGNGKPLRGALTRIFME